MKWDGSIVLRFGRLRTPLDVVICERRFGVGKPSSYIDLFHYSDAKCIKLCLWQLLFGDAWTRHHRAVGHRAWLDERGRA